MDGLPQILGIFHRLTQIEPLDSYIFYYNQMITLKLKALLFVFALVKLCRAEEQQDQVANEGIIFQEEIDESLLFGSGGIDDIKWDFTFPEESFTSWNYDDYLSANRDIYGSEDIPDLWRQDAEEALDFSIPSEFNITIQDFAGVDQSAPSSTFTPDELKSINAGISQTLSNISNKVPKGCKEISNRVNVIRDLSVKDGLNKENAEKLVRAISIAMSGNTTFCSHDDALKITEAQSYLLAGQSEISKVDLQETIDQGGKGLAQLLLKSKNSSISFTTVNFVGYFKPFNFNKTQTISLGEKLTNPLVPGMVLPKSTISIDAKAITDEKAKIFSVMMQHCNQSQVRDCSAGPVIEVNLYDVNGNQIDQVQFNTGKNITLEIPLYSQYKLEDIVFGAWDPSKNMTVPDGCDKVKVQGQKLTAICNHLTQFATKVSINASDGSVPGQVTQPSQTDDDNCSLMMQTLLMLITACFAI